MPISQFTKEGRIKRVWLNKPFSLKETRESCYFSFLQGSEFAPSVVLPGRLMKSFMVGKNDNLKPEHLRLLYLMVMLTKFKGSHLFSRAELDSMLPERNCSVFAINNCLQELVRGSMLLVAKTGLVGCGVHTKKSKVNYHISVNGYCLMDMFHTYCKDYNESLQAKYTKLFNSQNKL